MKWNNVKITIFKELRGIVRDKKSLHKILLLPVIIPVVLLLFGFLFDYMEESKYTIGINYPLEEKEKQIINELENVEFQTFQNENELKKAYDNQEINGYIIKEKNNYIIYSDNTVNSGEMVNYYATSYLDSYSRLQATEYLMNQNINPEPVFNNINIEIKSLAKEESSTMFTILLSLSITYILMIVVLTCTTVATDATSGEKERGTLETILTFPIKSSELVAGKYLATAILGFFSGLFSYLLTIPSISIGKAMYKSFEDISININLGSTLLVIHIILISALLSAGVCIALAGKSKTYKEAQSSLQFVSFLPMIPYFLKIMEVDNSIFSFVPIANCGMALNDIIMNKINADSIVLIILSSIIYISLIIIYISKQYKSEETLFS